MTCIICKNDFDESCFYNDKSKPTGKKPRCKTCEKLYIDVVRRRIYEKKYWSLRKEKRKIIMFKHNSKPENKKKYHLKREKKYNTIEFKSLQKIYSHKRRSKIKDKIDKNKLYMMIKNTKKCYYCGTLLNGKYEIDHKKPLSRGGDNKIENIAITCVFCNRSKGFKTENEFEVYRNTVAGVGYQMV
jgi:5-methylcytosine-specific restriction endonuclease McrA